MLATADCFRVLRQVQAVCSEKLWGELFRDFFLYPEINSAALLVHRLHMEPLNKKNRLTEGNIRWLYSQKSPQATVFGWS